jgi:hypothetical protein
MSDKEGFIYIWYDNWRKMYYIGCHWGTEDDGYICSSNRMRKAYRRRPQDFRRRIIQRGLPREVLLEEEFKWLSLIPKEQLGTKYYNLSTRHFGHWSSNPETRLTVGQKISASPNRNENIGKAHKGRIISEETRQKISISVSKTMTEEHRKLLSDRVKGFKHTEEARKKISEAGRRPCSAETKKKISDAAKGRIVSEETRAKSSAARLGKKLGPRKKTVT